MPFKSLISLVDLSTPINLMGTPPVETPNGMLQALLVSHSPPPAITVLYPLPLIFPFWGHFHSEFAELLVYLSVLVVSQICRR